MVSTTINTIKYRDIILRFVNFNSDSHIDLINGVSKYLENNTNLIFKNLSESSENVEYYPDCGIGISKQHCTRFYATLVVEVLED